MSNPLPNRLRHQFPAQAEESRAGVIRPAAARGNIFGGWGPKLLAGVLAASALGHSGSNADAGTLSKPACAGKDLAARAAWTPPLSYPTIAQVEHVGGTAVVRVHLAPNGALGQASIIDSTGQAALDAAALDEVRRSQFVAEAVNCKAVPGDYLFQVEFDPDASE